MSEVLFNRVGNIAIATLNRPKALNALTTNMCESLYGQLVAWNGSGSGVEMVILEGEGGKAFCAGGDVRAIVEDGTGTRGKEFFQKEYRLDYTIGTSRVPQVALIHGIVMGGGVGISLHGKYRVATEKTLFAMPETAIGLFPDVGASYFLPKMGPLGVYLGLTGARLKGYETVAAGIATHFVPSDQLPQLRSALLAEGPKALDRLASQHSDSNAKASVEQLKAKTAATFNHGTVEDILKALERDTSEWAKETLTLMRKMSPTSLKVSLRMIREAPKDLASCFHLEYRLGNRMLQAKGDFFEGVRAVLIDKDNAPKWNPASLEKVDVDFFFQPLSREQSSGLVLQ